MFLVRRIAKRRFESSDNGSGERRRRVFPLSSSAVRGQRSAIASLRPKGPVGSSPLAVRLDFPYLPGPSPTPFRASFTAAVVEVQRSPPAGVRSKRRRGALRQQRSALVDLPSLPYPSPSLPFPHLPWSLETRPKSSRNRAVGCRPAVQYVSAK